MFDEEQKSERSSSCNIFILLLVYLCYIQIFSLHFDLEHPQLPSVTDLRVAKYIVISDIHRVLNVTGDMNTCARRELLWNEYFCVPHISAQI
jgi:hypothetical protein